MVWSAIGPVPTDGIAPLCRIQSKSSDRDCVHEQRSVSKSQSVSAADQRKFKKNISSSREFLSNNSQFGGQL